ncbi:MAG TPA: cytochrome c biogenesis protein ResB [Pseudobdellovibrionaceae bacterium]|mgnify:CR=1 FL=1|nr:cytochrome c biogenesis protein ResB [Pseudobdellovibrionaceae bacterium]
MKKWIKPLASLKLAIFILTALAIVTAVGTFVEARYDAYAARKLVYERFWLIGTLILLVINLTAVMVDRWPWKRRHASFVLAHIGIIVLILGSYLTMKWGLDGNLVLPINDSNRFVQTSQTELAVYTSQDGDKYTETYKKNVDFFMNPPSVDKPVLIPTFGEPIRIIDYKKYVSFSRKVESSESPQAGRALRFQMVSDRVSQVDWLVQPRKGKTVSVTLGLAQIHLGEPPKEGRGFNEIYIDYKEAEKKLSYTLFKKDQLTPFKKGFVQEGQDFETGWMNMSFKVLRFFPHSVENWDITEKDAPTPLTSSAVQIEFQNKKQWMLLNDQVKLFTPQGVSIVSFRNELIPLEFSIFLKEFIMDRYPGMDKAMSYKSIVQLPGDIEKEISMNEPLKYEGLTFYQASFQNDETGKPVRSVLSVNYDPGRFLKYLGSLLISLGIILLFYFRNLKFKSE